MRNSLNDLDPRYVKKDYYPGLPTELQEFNYWIADSGHSIMAIPECLLNKADENGDLDGFECAFPVKYVLEIGYRIYKNHVIVDGVYSSKFGLVVDESYSEY